MEKIVIEKAEDTPEIIMDAQARRLSFKGRSLPEDVTAFYKPVFDWLESISSSLSGEFVIDIDLEYFNTASSKIILDIFMLIEEICDGQKSTAIIKWHHQGEDDDMREAGEEYSEIVSLKFEMISY
jgi:SiaC family regulatory phosphoprotein